MNLSESDFKILSRKIENHLGILFEVGKKRDLERQLKRAFHDSGFKKQNNFINSLTNAEFDSDKVFWLAKYLTIGETYFFRENKTLDILRYHILPKRLDKSDKKLVFWSTSCSTGEEPYTLAIMLKEYFPDNFSGAVIYATDVNGDFIQKAKKGVYRNWSFRNLPEYYRKKYFTRLNNESFKISDEIKSIVKFRFINLNSDKYPEPFTNENYFDIILFRNTMIYLGEKSIPFILNKFFYALNDYGYLITGVAETSMVNGKRLKPVLFNGIRIFQKDPDYKGGITSKTGLKTDNIQLGENISAELTRAKLKLSNRKVVTRRFRKAGTKSFSGLSAEKTLGSKRLTDPSYEAIIKANKKGEYAEVIEQIELFFKKVEYRQLSRNQKDELHYLYCEAYANLGKIDAAIKNCDKCLEENKLNHKLHQLISQLYVENSDLDSALSHLNKAAFINPNSAMLHFLKANINQKKNNLAEAKKEYLIALDILNSTEPELVLEEADGLTAARLKDITESMIQNIN